MEHPSKGVLDENVHGAKRSPCLLHTLSLPFDDFTQKRDSSVKSTCPQWSAVQLRCSLANCSLARRCSLKSSGPVSGLLALKLASTNLLLTVLSRTLMFLACSRRFRFLCSRCVPITKYLHDYETIVIQWGFLFMAWSWLPVIDIKFPEFSYCPLYTWMRCSQPLLHNDKIDRLPLTQQALQHLKHSSSSCIIRKI